MKCKYRVLSSVVLLSFFMALPFIYAQDDKKEYIVGIGDVLNISVIEPEKIVTESIVMLDGMVSFPYIGNVNVKGMTLSKIQEDIQKRLADGYLKYPIVSVSLKEARSSTFFVYGEVEKPGSYPLENNMTSLKAVSKAGGFTKYGSSNIKVLRPQEGESGYKTIKVNIKAVIDGSSGEDVVLQSGDIVVVSERML